ncbi:MAG: ABC transporter permease/substrate-binding protein [Myxococcota bacterium]
MSLPDGFWLLVAAHARLALAALLAAIALGLPLAIWGHRRPRMGRGFLAVAGVVQTIPGLALLAVMVPLLAAVSLPSIGAWPAWLGLMLYGVFPILQNGLTGLAGVDPALREAARGVGMTERQSLWQVELPLALPVLVAGVRTAGVWLMGMATLSTPIGAPSLGNPIFSGLQTRRYDLVLIGCIGSAALALLLDGLIRLIEEGYRRRDRRRRVVGSAGIAAMVMAAFVPLASAPESAVVVGAKTFSEQYILAALLVEEIEDEGEAAEVRSSLGSTVVFDALANGEIDLYVDYSGTIWATLMEREGSASRERVREEVEAWLREEHGIELVCALGFENTYALAVRAETAAEGVRSIGDLRSSMVVGGDYELFERDEWRAVVETYGLRFREQRAMDPALMVDALARGDVDVIGAYSTDGRLAALGHVVLRDPEQAIPPYDAIVLASAPFVERHPLIVERLRALEGSIDADAMRRMNLAVDGEGRAPAEVARDWRATR